MDRSSLYRADRRRHNVVAERSPVPNSLWRQRRGLLAGLACAVAALAGCTTGSATASTSPDIGPVANPIAFCGYLDRPAVAKAIDTYLGSVAGDLVCGDVHTGTALSRGGRFNYSGRGDPSVVVSLDILVGGLPDETLAGQERLDDGTDPSLKAWCGDGSMAKAGEINAFQVVPSDTLPIDMTGNQELVMTVQIHGYPTGTCAAGWALFLDLRAAGALDEKQFTRT
jgi:hypothetical protein